MKKELIVQIDSFGRTLIHDEKLLAAVAGALQQQPITPTDYNAACGDNAACSNTGCNLESI